jgi:formylmethanofuran dehydrogenase subunit A
VIEDYVAWTLRATQAMGIKVVNPGGISAFKFNSRNLGIDDPIPHYEVLPRSILRQLSQALYNLGVPHPLHIHCNNLGVPGNFATTLETISAGEGFPMHLTHIQFHSYGNEGDFGFSSHAAQIAEAVNANKQISIDVGQVIFGETVTASADTMSQYRNRGSAEPKRWVCMDIECDAGCGLVPMHYHVRKYANALQWCIGLEIFLGVTDPWRVVLTTDHPNGGPFTSYPHLIKLLMDKTFRDGVLSTIDPAAAKASNLGSMTREYSLYEVAIITRAGPARILGLRDRGHLGVGANADITVYEDVPDREIMFSKPHLVFKNGSEVVRDGAVTAIQWGHTHTIRPDYDTTIERSLESYFSRYHSQRMGNFKISDDEFNDGRGGLVVHQPISRSQEKG